MFAKILRPQTPGDKTNSDDDKNPQISNGHGRCRYLNLLQLPAGSGVRYLRIDAPRSPHLEYLYANVIRNDKRECKYGFYETRILLLSCLAVL